MSLERADRLFNLISQDAVLSDMKRRRLGRPLVTVVVPMFNHERFVADCLESVSRQDYPNLELLALDDGSKDRTFDRASQWAESRVASLARCELWRRGNAGICRTLNELVRRSRGEFILPLASDDLLHHGAIRELVDYHMAHCRPDELLFSNVSLIDLEGRTVSEDALRDRGLNASRLAQSQRLLKLAILLKWGDPFQHQFYPRKFFDLVGGYDEAVEIEDVYFATRAVALNKARFAPVKTKMYRIRPRRAATPGVSPCGYTPAPSRSLAAGDLPMSWRPLVRLVNHRDLQPQGPYRWMLHGVIATAFRGCQILMR